MADIKQPADRTNEEKVAARRKADYVVEHLDEYPKYVAKWVKAPWWETIRQDASFYSFMNHKTLPKEFAESYAAYKEVKYYIKKTVEAQPASSLRALLECELEVAPAVLRHNVLLVDMCCGKGFLSVLLNFKFPNAQVLMVDNMKKMNLAHIENMPRVDFWLANIKDPEFVPQLKLKCKDFASVIMVGIHLCGDLSEYFVHAFHSIPNVSCMVLCPCCISPYKTDLLEKAKRENLSNYQLWSDELLEMIQLPTKEMKKLTECSSEKNNFILAFK